MTMNQLECKLQKADRKQSFLYLFCNFVSLLLITAYAAMMFSPTVLRILPEGGDSRKQVTMIFALALFGCVVFTVYASGLFFRKKSKQLGTLMALGASRRRLAPGLFREVLLLSSLSSLLGIAAGFPFVFLLWNGFRLLIVDRSNNTVSIIILTAFSKAVPDLRQGAFFSNIDSTPGGKIPGPAPGEPGRTSQRIGGPAPRSPSP